MADCWMRSYFSVGSYPTAIAKRVKWPAEIVPLKGCGKRRGTISWIER